VRQSEIAYAKTSALRKQITRCNKVLKGARSHPNGLSGWTIEDTEKDLALIRAELSRRKSAVASHDATPPTQNGKTG
jgi:hypothetical protein